MTVVQAASREAYSETTADSRAGKLHLQRQIGLVGAVAIIFGAMIGSGIFISPKDVLFRSGSVAASLLVWLACGVMITIGALCYIELGCVVPKAGGMYAYIMESYGPLHPFFGPLPAFLLTYTRALVQGPSGTAALALSVGVYAVRPFYQGNLAGFVLNGTEEFNAINQTRVGLNSPPEYLTKSVAAGCVVLVTAINCFSTKLVSRTQTLFTVIKVTALLAIIVGGLVKLGQGHTTELETGFTPFGEAISVAGIAGAFYSGLWSYGGWNALNYAMEELKDPYRTLPRAIIIALPLVTMLYILTNIAYLTVLSTAEVLVEPAVAVEFGNRVLGVLTWIIPVSVVCAAFSSASGNAFANSRIAFAAAREGHLCQFLSFVSIKWKTPLMALLLHGTVSLILVAVGNITSLIDLVGFTGWTFSGLSFISLLIFRRSRPNAVRAYRVPLVMPIFMTLASFALVLLPLIQNPRFESFYGLAFMLSGLLFYVPFVYYRKTLACMDIFTHWVERAFRVAPSGLDLTVEVIDTPEGDVTGMTRYNPTKD